MEKSGTQTPLSLAAAEAVRTYAATTRSALGSAESPVISYAGLWLLLASLAPAAETETDEILGLNRADARAAALTLLEAPHPTIGAAVAGWLRPGVELTKGLPIMLDPLPEQAGLDAWADEHTRGLIKEFPLEIDAQTLLVLASALVVTPRWSEQLEEDEDGLLLLLEDGFQAVVETEAAGPVAVACPPSEDGISVYSVIAEEGVTADDVWRATDEVVRRIDAGEVHAGTFDAGQEDGHAWTVREVTVLGNAASDRWRSHLPEWSAEDRHDLSAAPGVAEIARGVMAAVEEESEAVCIQKAVASYDREGFKAAAVTGMMVRAAAAVPRETKVRQIDLRFDRPHAVVAVARGGAWEGIPLFGSWVTPA